MQRIVCRFSNGHHLLDHLATPSRQTGDVHALYFDRAEALKTQTILRMTLIVEATGETHDLHMRIESRRPTIAARRRGVSWRYRAVPTKQDRPWLEMLATKYATARRVAG